MRPAAVLQGALLAAGTIGLAGAMLGDAASVTGRHVGAPLVGAIEVVQAFIAVGASGAIAYASLTRAHAAVDLVFNRLPPWGQRAAGRLAALLGFLFLAGLLAGSAWILAEYWNADERTEIIGIPLRWLRLFWVACCLVAAVAVLATPFRPAGAREGRRE